MSKNTEYAMKAIIKAREIKPPARDEYYNFPFIKRP